MTDTPPAPPVRSRTPAAQTIALILLGGGALVLLAAIVWIESFIKLETGAQTLLFGIAQSLLGLIGLIGGFYWGASMAKPADRP